MPSDASLELKQDIFKREFRLDPRGYLQISPPDGDSYTIDLRVLDPSRQRKLEIPWFWLVVGLVLCVAALLWPSDVMVDVRPGNLFLAVPALLAILAGGIGALYWFFRNIRRHCVYRTRAAGFPLVDMLYHYPDTRSFEGFVEAMEERMRLLDDKRSLSDQQLRAGELKMFRRLAQQGVFKEKFYEQVKQQLLQS